MEFEKHNNLFNLGSQEVYAQENDLSFEADQENLNTSTSSDRFQTPSAKLIYDQISSRKQQSQNVKQCNLFQNLDPLNESNTQNKSDSHHQQSLNNAFNNSLNSTICIEKSSLDNRQQFENSFPEHKSSFLVDSEKADKQTTQDFIEHAMDLSNRQMNDRENQSSSDQRYEELLKEKTMDNEKLRNYVEKLNDLNKNLSQAILRVQEKFEARLNEKNTMIQDLTLQNSMIAKERELAAEDVQGLESSFSELHRRYEKLKFTLESCKKKEEVLQEECLAVSERLEESQRQNNEYKHRLEILENEKSNIEEAVKLKTEKEFVSLRAQLKKAEMRLNGFQNQLEQKTQENLELNKMVDELTK